MLLLLCCYQLQRGSLYAVEVAYTTGLAQADCILRPWQQRIAKGRIVGKFAIRVKHLLASVKHAFNNKVIGVEQVVRERGERLLMLRDHILNAAQSMFQQQVQILEYQTLAAFRRQLQQLVARNDIDIDAPEGKRLCQQMLRKAIFDFQTQVAEDLEDVSLGLVLQQQTVGGNEGSSSSSDKVAELTATLENLLKEFPDSPIRLLAEVKKTEKMATQGKPATTRRKGKKQQQQRSSSGDDGTSIAYMVISKLFGGMSVSIVGMLRTPGYGNLQGFVGYATSLLGIVPLDLLLGVQNDGEAPEVGRL